MNKTPIADAVEKQRLEQQLHADTSSMWRALGFMPQPTGVMGTMTQFVCKVALYAVGAVSAMFFTSYLSTLMLTASVPVFIVAVIEIMTCIIGIYLSWRASDWLVDYIINGGPVKTVNAIGSWSARKFNSGASAVKRRLHIVK